MIKQVCRSLRKHGYSIGQIARRLQVSESTVHWHVKDICLTDAQRERLKRQKRALMAKVNARRKGKPLKPVSFYKPPWSLALVHLIAHLSFDGRIDRYGCYYYSRSYQQAQHVRRSLKWLLGITPKIKRRPSGIWVVSFYNVVVADWLACKENELLHTVSSHPEWRRQWLQALFDDEGHIHLSPPVRRVRASQNNMSVLRYAQRFLGSMRIASRIDRHAHAVEITGRNNLANFRRLINFSHGIYVNENRKNGLWSQPLEKRKLLNLTLKSYGISTALLQFGPLAHQVEQQPH